MNDTENPAFLREVAKYWLDRSNRNPRLASLVFVTPNKRSAMFLKKYMRDGIRGVAVMPRFMTMRTFIAINSPLPEAPERELLFILYDAYRKTMQGCGRKEGVREFDSFIFWGDIMLADFDDIDSSMANASELFRNLKNTKEIQADYLDEDQKEVVRRIWGESRLTEDVDRFWLHVREDDPKSMGGKFLYLWEILGDVYRNFHAALKERGYSSVGRLYRYAVEHFKNMAPYDITGDTHYVFVGFNDLSTAETLIFDRLKALGGASFFWDTAPLRLCDSGNDSPAARPMRRLSALARHFPMPDDFSLDVPDFVPEIRVTAVPSNMAQTKVLGNTLETWSREGYISQDGMNTTVVVPDSGLLLPTLFSIPPEIEKVNISMGLPYKSTTFASLLHSIISMQKRARIIHGRTHFFYKDVAAILSHPHIRLIASGSADSISRMISDDKLYNIPADRLLEKAPGMKALFTAVREMNDVGDVADYLTGLLDWLGDSLTDMSGNSSDMFELHAIAFFKEEIKALTNLIGRYGVKMEDRTFMHLFEKVFNSRGLTLNGTPLQGMQVLGVLETRALDFDNVAIMSMNERIFPKKQYAKTMIPNALRHGFGLPDFDSLEWTYSYSFFRLLSRARRVALFYDSRAEALGGGEMSRYISQMRYLMPGLKVMMEGATFGAVPEAKVDITVAKTPDVMRHIDKFRAGGPLRLSVSALETFKKCSLQFYLAYVRSMRGSDELVEYISPSDYGTMVHNVIQELYKPYPDALIDASVIRRILDSDVVERTTRSEVIRHCYPEYAGRDEVFLPAEGEIGCEVIAAIARADMEAELEAYGNEPFGFVGDEVKYDRPWKIDEQLSVRFYMSIDRVDRLPGGKLRFIDFKTGDEKTQGTVEKMFSPEEHEYNGIFQLLTYCEAYKAYVDPQADIVPVLHPMRDLMKKKGLAPLVVDKRPVDSFRKISDKFLPELTALIKRIFDSSEPFTQCEDARRCKFCPFLTLCGRVVPDF